MKKEQKVKFKKTVGKNHQDKIIQEGGYFNKDGLWIDVVPDITSYNYKLSFNQNKYMKLWDDVELKFKIQEKIGGYLNHRDILWSFTDQENRIDFTKFNKVMVKRGWARSNLTAIKTKFIKAKLIKEYEGEYYFNPILGVKDKDIAQKLIKLFELEIKEYGVNVQYK